MQIPSGWYVHILPGIIILACILPLLDSRNVDALLKRLNDHFVGSAIILGIVAYVVGFAANAVALTILRPVLNNWGWLDKPDTMGPDDWVFLYRAAEAKLLEVLTEGYQNMILYRSIFGAFLLLSLSSLVGIIWRRNNSVVRIVAFVVLVIVTFALYKQWWEHRNSYHDFARKSVSAM